MRKKKGHKNCFISNKFNPSGSYTGNYVGKDYNIPEQDADDL